MLHFWGMGIITSLGKLAGQGNSFVISLLVAVFLFSWFASAAWGAGFALVQQGTAAMAQGNAFVAEASDASAIYYNPAGLNQLKGPQFYQGLFLNHPDREYSGGLDSETNHRFYKSMTGYLAIPLHDRVAVGVGFFSPFGMGTAWPPSWAGRYVSTFSSMKTYSLNPVISVKVLDNLSLAAGFDVLWSKVVLKNKTPVPPIRRIPSPDGEISLNGSGNGYGYNFGMLYEPLSGVKLGASYRSQIKVQHYGDLTTTLPRPFPAATSISGSAGIVYPASLTMGIAYNRLKPFTFEFDTTWTGWSSYDKLKLNLNLPISVNGVLTRTITKPKNWNDTFAFRFGTSYEIKEGMKIRAGYIYDLTPVPDSSFDPQVPDANRHIFTVGGDMKIWKFTLGIAYNYILSETRTKNNAIPVNGVAVGAPLQANGSYNSNVHSLALSWSLQF
jgi:long-chain fatty acid transport protein